MRKTATNKINFVFEAMDQQGMNKKYPCWRHHKWKKSIIVNNTKEDERAAADGYDKLSVPITANLSISNWFWDLEDFSPRQLIVYAREEFNVNLPEDATQEVLFRAVQTLCRHAPQNANRLVLMAHTVKMNYEETQAEIIRIAQGNAEGYEYETITEEIII